MITQATLLDWRKLPASLRLTRGAILLLLASAILLTVWSFVVPVFEAPDEQAHWQYARYLRVNKRLPFYDKQSQEANSPPLYYVVIAPFAAYTDIPPSLNWNGPDGRAIPALPRLYQNSYSDYVRYWPIRAARLATVLISLITVFFCYASGVEATGRVTTGLLAGALVAFLPQFTFRGMNVSNDAMVTAMSSVVLYCLVRMIKQGVTQKRAIAGAIGIAAAFLSKTSAIFLPIPFAIVVLSQEEDWKTRLKALAVLSISFLLVAPWLIRNQLLYGDPLVQKAMLMAVDFLVSQKSISSPYFIHVFPQGFAVSLVGVFGWFSLWPPKWLYHFFWLTAAAGFAGWLIAGIRGLAGARPDASGSAPQIDRRLAAVLASMPLLNLIVVIYINLTFDQPQGRYMFPSLPALALLVAVGLEYLPRWTSGMSRCLAVALALVNAYIVIRVVLPAYWPPPAMAFSEEVEQLQAATSSPAHGDEVAPSPRKDGHANEPPATAHSPEFVFKTDLVAARYNYFTCTLRGCARHGLVTGKLYLGFCPADTTEQQSVQFKWICDGTDHPVIVPLWTLPGWGGRLTEVRLEPYDSAVSSHEREIKADSKDCDVKVGRPAIVGSLTSLRGP
jgi:4-amino-4-deoxy-L-arabinose transferase-like glycosyltransferase